MKDGPKDVLKAESGVVVVGGGQAAAAIVRTLRTEGYVGRIVMLSAESFGPYDRPPLSKGLLLGTKEPADLLLLDAARLRELEVDVRFGVQVTSIDRTNRVVCLDSGATVAYDKLVIATGGRPRRLEIPGDASGDIAYLRTVDNALALRERMLHARRILIIGGGWIGLETASSARRLGLEVTLVEAGARLCERAVPPIISDLLLERHRKDGVDVLLATQVTRLERAEDGALRAVFEVGASDFDLVVAGVGMIPNDELAATAGLPCASGVLCDNAGRTSDPVIFACGDVAAFVHPYGPAQPRRLESWDNAERQGAACARALLGKEAGDSMLPWFWSEQGDTNLQIFGFPDGARPPVIRSHDGKTILFWLENGRIDAAICVDTPADMSIIRRLWKKGVKVEPTQLSDPSVSLKSLFQAAQIVNAVPVT